jgi:hypothetical protein
MTEMDEDLLRRLVREPLRVRIVAASIELPRGRR